MKTVRILLFLWFMNVTSCWEITELFEKINKDVKIFNSVGATIAWESSVNPNNPDLLRRAASYQRKRINWQDSFCDKLMDLKNQQRLNDTQSRQAYLLCRGPKFTYEEAGQANDLYQNLQSVYSDAKICLPVKQHPENAEEIEATIMNFLTAVKKILKLENDSAAVAAKNAINFDIEQDVMCLKGETEFENLMRFSKNEKVLRFLWLVWREKVGKTIRKPYDELVDIGNRAARRNGYNDIGASWREELEIPNLRQICRQLYYEIRPLYSLLHGVTRFFLRNVYGDVVSEDGPIPAHLLGDLWSQNWESLADLIIIETINLDENIKKLNWTVTHMVKRAEDFYQSIGLPLMTNLFWRKSVFNKSEILNTRCHGTAADMFKDSDYRLLYCSGRTMSDLYVIHHEMGHIEYFMAYAHQPSLFRQANTALHETIGDTIMLGVMTPQHLHRLGLINDTILYNNNNRSDSEVDDDENGLKIEVANKREVRIPNASKEQLQFSANKDLGESEKPIKLQVYWKDKINGEEISNKINDEQNSYSTDNRVKSNRFDMKLKRYTNNFKNQLRLKTNVKRRIFENFKREDINNPAETTYKDKYTETKTELPKLKLTTDEILMLKLALNKIPQMPFALLIDEYRWKYFEGNIDEKTANKEFWDLALELQGIAPPEERGEDYFDVAAKFHIPDNTPYIRYFLSSFLQHQLFEYICKTAVYGRRGVLEPIPQTITLNRCDIYGSKASGKVFRDIMSRGDSQSWQEILRATIGTDSISGDALNRYYHPLYKILERFVEENQIPVGW